MVPWPFSWRKRLQELKRSEAYLAEGQRLSHTATWAWNVTTGEVIWSREHFRIFGRDPERDQPTYPNLLQWMHPDDRPRVRERFEAAFHCQGDYEVDFRALRPDGEVRYVHTIAHPVFRGASLLAEYVGTSIDRTEQRLAEARLRESERRFRALVESIPHHVWSFRTDGKVGYFNQQLLDYTGLSPEQLRNGGWEALHPDDIPKVGAAWRKAWANGTPYDQEQRIRGSDGGYRRFLCRAIPVRDGGATPHEWFGTDTDVEELRRAEEALHDAHAKLTHVARVTSMGELAATLAHELNQPLAAIVANGSAALRWLRRECPNLDEATQALERIMNDANRAGAIISHARAFLRRGSEQRASIDLAESTREILLILKPEIDKHHIALTQSCASQLSPVMGSKVQLQQVVLNLVLNAIEAMGADCEKPKELAVRIEEHSFDRTQAVSLAVQDSGCGVPIETLDRLFDAFYTTKAHGLGMGLSISRSIVEAHGGSLWATQNHGRGATFQFVLPAA